MEAQAQGQAPAQAQAQVHPVHAETQMHEQLTRWVAENPDNDPHAGTSMEVPPATPQEQEQQPQEQQAEQQQETVEFDEETPIFDVKLKTEKGEEERKLSLKEMRDGYLRMQDYHRNIQKVKAQEQEITQRTQKAEQEAQQKYYQQLEVQKQAIAKLAGVKSMPEIEALAKEDPAQAQQEFLRFLSVSQQYQQIEQAQHRMQEEWHQKQQVARAEAKLKAREVLETDIKGWNGELYNKVLETVAKDYGFQEAEVEPVVDARLIKVFHDAYQYRQLQRAKPEISKKVVAVPKVVKPGSAQGQNTSSGTDEAEARLKKSGRGEDFVAWYLEKQKQQKRK